jgi:hypothetical protein
MSLISIHDAIDMHCHSGPSLFRRKADALDISLNASKAGMRGIVFKTHFLDSTDRCYFVNRALEEIYGRDEATSFEAFASITLNLYQGGLNVFAVRECLKHGGKIIYMPTIHAANHAEHFGPLGSYRLSSMTSEEPPPESGISVLNESGELLEVMKEIVQVVKQFDAVIGTSHLSPVEMETLISYAGKQKVNVVLTHAFVLPHLELDFYKKMSDLGAYIELCSTNAGAVSVALGDGHTLPQAIELIEVVGADKCVISSDAGQPFNPWPHESIQLYAQALHEYGVSEEDLRKMMVENPSKLLRI